MPKPRRPHRFPLLSFLLALAPSLSGCAAGRGREAADLVVWGVRVVTVDADRPEAEAVAVRGDRIVAVGTRAEIERLVGEETRVLDAGRLGGRLLLPGFIESHGHFLGVGDRSHQIDLRPARSFDDVVRLVADAVARVEPGVLVRGRGWHQEKWVRRPTPSVDGFPVHAALSAVSPRNPVVLTHASGHAVLVNARALELAGIDRDTPDPAGGEILRDGKGDPTGVLLEDAEELLQPLQSVARPPDPERLALAAAEECVRKGITTFCDAGVPAATVELYRRLVSEGRMPLRLWVMLGDDNDVLRRELDRLRTVDFADHHLTVRAIKRFMDGALGSHGAWLLEPYSDLPDSVGLQTTPTEELEETARLALEHGCQLCVHAIGDRANRETLDLFERAFRGRPDARELRWRIEHAQHLHPDDVARFARLGVVASMQTIHCVSDAPFVVPRLGRERARQGAYVWRSLVDSGAVLVNGTDAPVEDVDPLPGFFAAVTRRLPDGGRFFPEQCLTREEALRAITRDAAWAAFQEHDRGTLTPGKLADFVLLSRDLLRCPEEEIPSARVLLTVVGGRVVFAAPGLRDRL